MSERENDIRIKFMHAGDIHLDTPVIGMTPEKSDERKREIRQYKKKSLGSDLAVGLTGNRKFRVIRPRVFLGKGNSFWSCHFSKTSFLHQ